MRRFIWCCPDYKESIAQLCRQYGIELLIPGSDPELLPLAELAEDLGSIGCRVVVSSPECIKICRDKQLLHDYLTEQGVSFAPTYSPAEAMEELEESDYPLILKPRSGSGSVGTRLLFSQKELEPFCANGYWVVQPYLLPVDLNDDISDRRELLCRLRRLGRPLQNDELSIQVFISEGGDILGHFASLNKLKDGVPVRVDPVDEPQERAAAAGIAAALIKIGLMGPCNFQGRYTEHGIVFFEVNPRFTGITHVRALMGYREVEAAVKLFISGADKEKIANVLQSPTDKVGLRQMTEIVIPRSKLQLLCEERASKRCGKYQRILVTGVGGYLGFSIAEELLRNEIAGSILAPVKDLAHAASIWRASEYADRVNLVEWDLKNPGLDLSNVDLVIHAAALRQVQERDRTAFFDNQMTTLNVVIAARKAAIPRFIYISSQSVYGVSNTPPFREDSPVDPCTDYSHSKLAGEMIVKTLEESATDWMILRLSRLYGFARNVRWHEMPHKFAQIAIEGSELRIRGGGDQRMDLLHISDAVSLVVAALDSPQEKWNEIYNAGGGNTVSIHEMAEICRELAVESTNVSPKIIVQHETVKHPSLGLDIDKAIRKLGWRPAVGIREGISELMFHAAEDLKSQRESSESYVRG